MKKLTLFALIITVFAFKNPDKLPTLPNDVLLQLRLVQNDLLVGEYDATTGRAVLKNLNNIIGAAFSDLTVPEKQANRYYVVSTAITHTGNGHFYIELTGSNANMGDMVIALPLYIDKNAQQDKQYATCPNETHCCQSINTATCAFGKNNEGCIIGCQGDGSTCSHTVTTSSAYGDFIKKIADNSGL